MNVNTNRMVELALVFFVSLLSFSIGTFVGKKYSDNQHRLAMLEPHGDKALKIAQDLEGNHSESQEPTITTKKQEVLTDEEVAQLAQEFKEPQEEDSQTQVETIVTKMPATTTNTKSAMKKLETVVDKNTKDIKEVELKGEEVVREVASIAAKAKQALANEPVGYTVQVAAYPSQEEADKMVSTLLARGYKGKAVVAEVNGRKWYRVQVGTFENFQEADAYKKEVMEQNRLTSALVQKVTK